ncbi:excinuclease [Dyella sp.]|uniref:excinuclease n=1 Tax=Dyella sp. TaxID=1869338 RepID=UPI002ED47159
MKATYLIAAVLFALPAVSMAADKVVHLPFQAAVDQGTKDGKLDGSVKFYLAGNKPSGKMAIVNDNVTISRKTNAFAKSDEATCHRVMESVLIALQDDAKRAGANAVVDIVSNYNDQVFSDPTNYECHKGFLMSGVAVKAKFAKVH